MVHDWRRFFPFKEPRIEQIHAIDSILTMFLDEGRNYVVAELGTGIGKSAIAVTVSRYLQSLSHSQTWYLTTQKVLQQQYVDDFSSSGLKTIKSSSNYTCQMYTGTDTAMSCAGIKRLIDSHGFFRIVYKTCMESCRYREEKNAFIDSDDGVTNYSYFLAEAKYAGQIEQRELLVCDEAHTIESALSSFVEFTISEKFAKMQLGLKKIPVSSSSIDDVVNWLQKSYKKSLQKKIDEGKRYMKEHETEVKLETLSSYVKRYELLDKHICKLNRFLDEFDSLNWTMTFNDGKFTFKPVDVSVFANDQLLRYGKKILFLSATILDVETFCKTLGLNNNVVGYVKMPSPFSVKNRPIHSLAVGSMSKSKIDQTLPLVANAVKTILDAHSDEKGIIHCVSFKVARYISENVMSDRLLLHGSDDRDAALNVHFSSKKPTVLLSPSMMEGIDLKDDRSRFQVICKVPFPFLGDEVVRKRMALNPRWYPCQTMRSIVQALGRSIRNEDDHATSYILDSDWEYFLKKNRSVVPEEILNALC